MTKDGGTVCYKGRYVWGFEAAEGKELKGGPNTGPQGVCVGACAPDKDGKWAGSQKGCRLGYIQGRICLEGESLPCCGQGDPVEGGPCSPGAGMEMVEMRCSQCLAAGDIELGGPCRWKWPPASEEPREPASPLWNRTVVEILSEDVERTHVHSPDLYQVLRGRSGLPLSSLGCF